MNLEVGDYFVITQGAEMHPVMMGLTVAVGIDLPLFHDTTWTGIVLEAKDIQAAIVAAEIVGRSAGAPDAACRQIGTRHVIDLTQIQWQTVGKRFAQLMSQPAPAPKPALVVDGVVQMGGMSIDQRDQT